MDHEVIFITAFCNEFDLVDVYLVVIASYNEVTPLIWSWLPLLSTSRTFILATRLDNEPLHFHRCIWQIERITN